MNKRDAYRKAIAWLATNTDPADVPELNDFRAIGMVFGLTYVPIRLVAHIFDKDERDVESAVQSYRDDIEFKAGQFPDV